MALASGDHVFKVLDEPVVREGATGGTDRRPDPLPILGLRIPCAPAIRPQAGDVRRAIDVGDGGVTIERQHRGVGAVDVGG